MQKQSKPQGILVISILTMITGIILFSVGFLYISSIFNSTNVFLMMFVAPFLQILAFINLILSMSFFANYYGLIKAIEWSRSIAIKLFFIFIIIAFINIFINFIIPDDFTLITNVNQSIVTILSSIGICCSIIGLFFLYQSNVKIYYYQLKVVHEQEINNINPTLPLSSTNKITFFLTSFLIADTIMTVISSFQSFGIIGNIHQDSASLSNIIMVIIGFIIYGGIIIFPIWWFSRTYINLKRLGIPGLDFSAIRVVLSFFIPIRNLYEPVKLLKTLWKASTPYINNLKWKDVAVPTGLGLWWFLVLASAIDKVIIFDSSGRPNVFIESIQTILGLIFTPMANIATIMIVRRINTRIEEKIDKTKNKILLYSDKNLDSFAIKLKGENDFKAIIKDNTTYSYLIDQINFTEDQFADMSWEQILKKWISWLDNIDHNNYEYLKSHNLLYIINENEEVKFITEKKDNNSNNSSHGIIIVTNIRIIIVKGKVVFETDSKTKILNFGNRRMNWNLHSIIAINEIQSIKTKEGIFSCNLIIKTDEEIQINSIRIPIAQEIVVYINDLIAKNYRNSIENILK
jgi:hypothetical protein